MGIKFEDNRVIVKETINDSIIAWLYEAAGELQAQTVRNSRTDTGQTKAAWTYVVDESKGEATIGNPLENAIWEEFGTGQYAIHGDGRKKPWKYKDRKGKWHTTKGKTPNRTLERAFTTKKAALLKALENRMKGV